jgi:hypothetical protein
MTRFLFWDELMGEFADVCDGDDWDRKVSHGSIVKLLPSDERELVLHGGVSLENTAAGEWDEPIPGRKEADEGVLMSQIMKRFVPVFEKKLRGLGVDRQSAAAASAELSGLFQS